MRLVSLYIENFGGLSRYALRFDPQLTVVEEPNGFGKTTLAEFIRAMFYGFPRASGKLEKNLRKKYMPWQGGRYGGNLVFAQGDKLYKIERFFGTAPKQDTFVLYDHKTHRKSLDYTENIGVELFQLDSASFERSTYLPQNREETVLATDNIRAKLGNLVEDTGDVNNFEKAMETLRTRRSAFVPYRGDGGTVARAQKQILKLQEQLDRRPQLLQSLDQVRGKLLEAREQQAVKEGARERIRREISAVSEAAARQTLAEQYQNLLQQQTMDRQEQAQLQARFPRGLPPKETLDQLDTLYDEVLALEHQAPRTEEEDRLRDQLQVQRSRFAEGIPTREAVQQLQQDCRTYISMESAWKTAALTREEQERHGQLQRQFAGGPPSREALARQREKLRTIGQLRQENAALAAAGTVEQPEAVPEVKKPPTVLLLIAALAALIGGVVLMALQQYAPGGGLLAVGVVVLVAAGYLRLHQEMHTKLTAVKTTGGVSPEKQGKIKYNEEQARQLEQEIRQFLAPYDGQTPPAEALPALEQALDAFETLSRRSREEAQQLQQLQALEQQISRALTPYFEGVEPARFLELSTRLEQDCSSYADACRRLAEKQEAKKQQEQQLLKLQERFKQLQTAANYPLQAGNRRQLQQLREALAEAANLSRRLQDNSRKLEQFLQEHGPQEAPAARTEVLDAESLHRAEEELNHTLTTLGRTVLELEQREKDLRQQLDQLPEKQDERDRLQEQQQEQLQKASCLDQTMEFLQQARDRLSGSYLGPVQQRFGRYLKLLTDGEQTGFSVSPDLAIAVERQGATRELGYFSAGQTDLVVLCMRLALVDTLFRAAEPLVILDDPFVNLDDAHTARALQLLRQLSEDHQILYLVCNSSRSL